MASAVLFSDQLLLFGHAMGGNADQPTGIERRLAALAGHFLADLGELGAHLTQHGFGLPPLAKVLTGNARRPATQLLQHNASHLVDQGFVRVTAHKGALLLLDLICNSAVWRVLHQPCHAVTADAPRRDG